MRKAPVILRFVLLIPLVHVQADVGDHPDVSAFMGALIERPPNLAKAVSICETGRLPIHANLRFPTEGVAYALHSVRLDSFLVELLPTMPDAINVLACAVQKRVIHINLLPDGGAKLFYIAASKKHLRLVLALQERNVPHNHTDIDDANATVLHAVLRTRIFALDIIAKVLQARGLSSNISWLQGLGTTVARHMGAPASVKEVQSAVDALIAPAALTQNKFLGPKPLRSADALAIGNGLSWLLLRVILDNIRKGVQSAAAAESVQGVQAAPGDLTSGSESKNAVFRAISLLQAVDRYGRTPLHIAAVAGNSRAASSLCETLYSFEQLIPLGQTVALVIDAELIRPGASGDFVSTRDVDLLERSAALARVARFVRQKDSRGLTAIQLACIAGHDNVALVLEHVLAQADVLHTTPTFSRSSRTSAKAFNPLLQSVSSWSAAYASMGLPRTALCAFHESVPPTWDSQAGIPIPVHTGSSPALSSNGTVLAPQPTTEPGATLNPELVRTNGGWHAPSHVGEAAARAVSVTIHRAAKRWGSKVHCDIDVANGTLLSPADFYAQYVLRSRPVLLKAYAASWRIREAWSFEALTTGDSGKSTFEDIGRVPYGAALGENRSLLIKQTTLAAFLHGMMTATDRSTCPPATRGVHTGVSEFTHCLQADAAPYYIFDSPSSAASRSGVDSVAGAATLLDSLVLVPPFLLHNVSVDCSVAHAPHCVTQTSEQASADCAALNGVDSAQHCAAQTCNEQVAAGGADDILSCDDASVLGRPPSTGGDALVQTHVAAPKPQFYIGGPGSGAPLHWHKDAWNVVAWGRKHWWLLPPAHALYSKQPPMEWAEDPERVFAGMGPGGVDLHPLECVQEAGDVLYVPAGWGHAVLNTEVTVGAAVEMTLAGAG